MSTLRTFNLQNPDSGTVNIEMDQGGNTLMTGIATVRGAAHFTSTSGSDAVGIGTDITAYKLDVRVTGAEAGLRVYNPDTSSNASGILRLGNDDNQNAAFLRLNGANNTSAVGGAGSLVLGHGLSKDLHLSTAGVSRLKITSSGQTQITGGSTPFKVTHTGGDCAQFHRGSKYLGINADWGGNTGDSVVTVSTNLVVHTNGSNERLRIDSSGHLLHGVTADEDTSGNGGLRFINSGDIQIDGDQKALVFRSTNNTAQLQSAIEWWNENGAGVQAKIACDRTAVPQAPSDLVFYTSPNVDTGGTSSDGDITERVRISSNGNLSLGTTVSNERVNIHTASSLKAQVQFTNTTTGTGGGDGLVIGITGGEDSIFWNQENTNILFATNNAERVRITSAGKLGIGVQSPFSRLQSGGHTFNGGNGMHSNDRVGMSNHGNLTGLMLASTYNDGSHPEYGLVFVQGPNTSSYNVWSVSPDGPAKGNSLNLHYGAQTANIHVSSNRKFEFTGDGYLLKPNHPSFRVGRHTDYNHTAGQPVHFNTTSGSAHLNQGGHYSTSNHRFTAPVAGVYQFSACVIVNGIANNTDLTDLFYLYKNGTNMAYSMRRSRYVSGSTGTAGYFVDSLSNVNVLMAANDYCEIICRLTLSIHGNSAYTWFSGTLVG